MLCEEAAIPAVPGSCFLLDRGKVKAAKSNSGEFEFFGTVLRGRYRLTHKKGEQ